MTRTIHYGLIAILACILALMCLMLAGPEVMNADTPLLAVVSIQRPTLFIWGQNRFLGIVPAVASFIRTPDANLILQLLLFGGGVFCFLAFLGHQMASQILRSRERVDAWLCFGLLVIAFVAITSRFSLHVFVGEGQPYGLSCLLMGVGLFTVLAAERLGTVRGALAFLAMAIGGGLNPSLLIVTSALCVGLYLFWPRLRLRATWGFLSSALASGMWLVIGRFVPGPDEYGQFRIGDFASNIERTVDFMRSGFSPPGLAAAALVSVAAGAIVWLRRGTDQNPRPRWRPLAACVAFSLGWVALFAQNAWVIANGWHFRYFFPVFFCLPVLLALPAAMLLRRFDARVRVAATAVAFACSAALLAAPWQPFDDFSVFARVKPHVEEAKKRDIRLVAGDYWRVWPSVFLMMRDGPAFGLAYRAVGNKVGVQRYIREIESGHGRVQALCLDMEAETCAKEAASVTEMSWRVADGTCGQNCSLIEISRPE